MSALKKGYVLMPRSNKQSGLAEEGERKPVTTIYPPAQKSKNKEPVAYSGNLNDSCQPGVVNAQNDGRKYRLC